MKVVVREAAAADLKAAIAWIRQDSPRAAENLRRRIVQRINHLTIPGLSRIGRPGRVKGTRELIVHPYIIVYEVNIQIEQVVVLAILHAARHRA